MNPVLPDPPYSTRSGQGQSDSTHDVVPKRDVKDTAKLVVNVMVSGPHGHVFSSDLMLISRTGDFVRRRRR